jgi:hypothetical protein
MPRLPKGSAEAKERMAHLRTLRKKKGGSIPEMPILAPESPAESETTKKGTGMKTAWVKHVADFAHKNNMNYFEALKDPKVKEGYKKK